MVHYGMRIEEFPFTTASGSRAYYNVIYVGSDMGFKEANTAADNTLKRLWPNHNPHGQDPPLKCPCRSAKGDKVPAVLQQGHLVEAIVQIQKGPEMVSSLPLEKVFDHW